MKKPAKRQPFTKISEGTEASIVAFIIKGNTFQAAKAKFGVSAHTCSSIFKRSGKKVPMPAKTKKPDAGKVAEKAVKASKPAKPATPEPDVL